MTFTLVILPPQPLELPFQTEGLRAWGRNAARDLDDVDVVVCETDEDAIEALKSGAEAAAGTLPLHLLKHANNLQWLQAPATNPGPHYYYPELADHPVVVTSVRGAYDHDVAAHVLALVLAHARGLNQYIRQQIEHQWIQHNDPGAVLHLPEATVLIVGVGNVGAEVARLFAPFGCNLLGVDTKRVEAPFVEEIFPADQLDDVLRLADVVIVAVPQTPKTTRLFDAKRLAKAKRGMYLVNIARGPIVDVDAVAAAVADGRLSGAGLDVFGVEREAPLAADHPIWDLPQVIITPHVSGVGPHLVERRYQILLENARRFGAGQPLLDSIDKVEWY